MDPHETRTRMIAGRFSIGGFLFGLRFGLALFDALDDLLFTQAGIFQASDRRAAHRRAPFEPPAQHKFQRRIRQTNQPQSHEISTQRIEFVRLGDFQNLRFGVPGGDEVGGGFATNKRVFVVVGGFDQGHTGIVAKIGLLDSDQLRDFGVGGIERFELFETAGPHAGPVKRAIIRQRMMPAPGNKNTYPEKQNAMLHSLIVAGESAATTLCAEVYTRQKYRECSTLQR